MLHQWTLISSLLLLCCGTSSSAYELRVVNTSPHPLARYPVSVDVSQLPDRLHGSDIRVTAASGERLVSQTDSLNEDLISAELLFLADIAASSALTVRLERKAKSAGDGKPISDGELAASLPIPSEPNLENRWLRWEPTSRKGFQLLDRKDGKPLLELGMAWEGAFAVDRGALKVVSGPVRSVATRSAQVWAENGSEPHFRERQRYVLHKSRPRLDLHLTIKNVTDQERPVPDGLRLVGRMGPRLVRGLGEVELFHEERAHYDGLFAVSGAVRREYAESPRLWLNPTTEYSMAYFPHSAESSGAGAARYFGVDYFRFNPSVGSKLRIAGPRGKLEPGAKKSLDVSFVLYEGAGSTTREQYRRDLNQVSPAGVVSVYDERGRVLQLAGKPLHIMDGLANPGRWVASSGAQLEWRDDGALTITGSGPEAGVFTTFARNFDQPTELRGKVSSADGIALRVAVEDPKSGTTRQVGRVNGTFKLNLSEALPYEGVSKSLLRLQPVVEGDDGTQGDEVSVTVRELVLTNPKPERPDIPWPRDGQKLSDVGVSFTLIDPAGLRYRGRKPRSYAVQVARDAEFEDRVIDATVAPDRDLKGREGATEYLPEQLLEKGGYYWRARALERGSTSRWTRVKRFVVDSTTHRPAALVRPITPSKPGVILRGWGGRDPQREEFVKKLRNQYSDAMAELLIGQQNYAPDEDYATPFLAEFPRKVSMPKLEHAYRNQPKAIGVLLREAGFDRRYLRRLLQLSGKYGRYISSLNLEKDLMQRTALSRDMYPLMEQYGKYLLPQHKMNNPREPVVRALTEAGAYLSGRIDAWGTETEWGYAWKAMWPGGERWDAQVRPINWMPPLIYGLATGAVCYRVENFSNSKPHRSYGVRRNEGSLGNLWHRAMGPLLEDILKYDLIPTREEMRTKLKVGLAGKAKYGLKRPSSPGTEFPVRVLAALNGIPIMGIPKEHVFEHQWVPESSQFYFVPILPSYLPDKEAQRFEHVIDAESFAYPEDAVAYAKQFYPPHNSEAYATLVGDTGIVINGIDKREDPRSGPQAFELDLTRGPVRRISGEVDYQAYLLMKQRKDSLFIHSKNYWTNYTELTLKSCNGSRPRLEVMPASALRTESWDAETGKLKITLSHHEGVTRATLEPR